MRMPACARVMSWDVARAVGPFVVQVALCVDAQPPECPLAYAAYDHRDIRHNGMHAAFGYALVQAGHGLLVGVQQLLHLKIGRRVYGVQQCPFVVERHVRVLQLAGNGAEAAYHNVLVLPLFRRCGPALVRSSLAG